MKFIKDTITKFGETLVVGDLLRLEEDADGRVSIRATGAGGTGILLDDLTDVFISSPSVSQYLRYTGSQWVNATITSGDLPSLGNYLRLDGSTPMAGTLNMQNNQITWGPTIGTALNLNNGDIVAVNTLSFADPGVNEGLSWTGGSGWRLYESPDNLSNTGGNLQIVLSGTRIATFDILGGFSHLGKITITGNAGAGILAASDNTVDIGAAGASRFRTGYFGSSLIVGTDPGGSGVIRATGSLNITGVITQIGTSIEQDLKRTDGGVDSKTWNWFVQPTVFDGRILSDDRLSGVKWIRATRSAMSISNVQFYTGADVLRWQFDSNGHFIAGTDNTYDIGAAGATRPRIGYFGDAVVIGTDPGGSTDLRVGQAIRAKEEIFSMIASGTQPPSSSAAIMFGTTSTQGNHRAGFSCNGYWNGANWIFQADGANSGGQLLLGGITGPGWEFYTVITSGNATQTIPNTELTTLYKRFTIGNTSITATNISSFIIGTDPGSSALLRVGGDARFRNLALIGAGTGEVNGSIEIGRIDGVSSNPFIDFHAGATLVDYDARISVTNGVGFVGSGTLSLSAALLSTSAQAFNFTGSFGGAPGIIIGTTTATDFLFKTSNSSRWAVDANGHFVTVVDNTYDIGRTSSARPRNVLIANSLVVGTDPTGSAVARFGGDIRIGTNLGIFDSTSTPSTDYLLSYNGTKWVARNVQLSFASGDVASDIAAAGAAGTAASYVRLVGPVTGTIQGGTPANPVLTPGYKSMLVAMQNVPFPGSVWVVDFSDDGFGTFSSIETTGKNIVHSRLTLGTTYSYRYRNRGTDGFGLFAGTSSSQPSSVAESNTFGIILASQISTANLSSINADIGTIQAGKIQNALNTAGILIGAGTVPASWTQGIIFSGSNLAVGSNLTRYIDFGATGTNKAIKFDNAFSLDAQGNAVFSGSVSAGRIENAAATIGIRIDVGTVLPGTWTSYLDLAATGTSNILKVGSAVSIDAQGSAIFSGTLQAGRIRNVLNTVGIRIDSGAALPGSWTTYLDLAATGTTNLLHHPGLDLTADGRAIFSGTAYAGSLHLRNDINTTTDFWTIQGRGLGQGYRIYQVTGNSIASIIMSGTYMGFGYLDMSGGVGTTKSNLTKYEFGGETWNTLIDKGDVSGTINVDWNAGNVQRLRLTGTGVTINLNNGHLGGVYTLIVHQDGTGSRTVTTWGTSDNAVNVVWPAGTAPTLTTTVDKADIFTFVKTKGISATDHYYGTTSAKNYAG